MEPHITAFLRFLFLVRPNEKKTFFWQKYIFSLKIASLYVGPHNTSAVVCVIPRLVRHALMCGGLKMERMGFPHIMAAVLNKYLRYNKV